VPPRIATEEVLPQLQADPAKAKSLGLQVFDRDTGQPLAPEAVDWHALEGGKRLPRLEQPPGPNNPLGPLKLVLDNPQHIFLHGTSRPEVFAEAARALSHGCIRVEDIAQVAQLLLGPADGEVVEGAVAVPRTQRLELDRPVRVWLLYFTSWVEEDGTLHHYPDLYRHDRTLAKELERPDERRARLGGATTRR
jgi:L,D-transpeptidase YcbB